jgi:histidyl-tRNA synthetase
VNPRLVRGLDYYTRTVFEWLSDRLGAQAAICAGGRYDGLVELLGGKPAPAIGCAIGLERLVELLTHTGGAISADSPQVYLVDAGAPPAAVLQLAEALRDRGISAESHCGGGSLKTQLKRADRSGARYALLVETPVRVVVKDLRGDEGQRTLSNAEVGEHLVALLAVAADSTHTSTRVEKQM